jgi:hypothetical protein
MNIINDVRRILNSFVLLTSSLSRVCAQELLDKHITLEVHHMPLQQVLEEIGRKGGFYFSYKTNIIKGDSLVDADAHDRKIRQILDQLLGEKYEYVESGKYVILLPKANAAPVKIYTISGYVEDANTRQRICNASVYESNQLVSTLTDTSGIFRLKLKDRDVGATIIVSKERYRDTLLVVHAGYDQELNFDLVPARISELTPFVVSSHMERNWLSRLFLSARQKIQNRNLTRFVANKPGQVSLIPGVGTRGRMSAQVVNTGSINIVGGYTAGAKMLELAGVFNIDKKDVSYLQGAGLFNVVGGNVKGLQMAGFSNYVYSNAHGIQLAGFMNSVKNQAAGVQAAGFLNNAGTMKGASLAGFANICRDTVTGVQAAGFINKAGLAGSQVAGFINIAGKVRGVQIAGFINIADSSDWPIGIVNIIKNGERSIGISTDETLTTLLTFRSGGRKLYGILGAGSNGKTGQDLDVWEAGIGAHTPISRHFRINTELVTINMANLNGSHEDAAAGATDRLNAGDYFRASLRILPAVKLTRHWGLFAGPSFNYVHSDDGKGAGLVSHYTWSEKDNNILHGLYFGAMGGLHFIF